MDFEKFIDLQKQMRENNAELADYLDDLAGWKRDIDLKNQNLKNTQLESRPLPAVRNSLFQKRKKKIHSEKPKSKPKERIKSYDYRAWDKFDVDKALAENDQTEQQSNSDSETDDELENQRRISLADDARNLGNVRFKEGKFDESIEQYSLAIRLCPENPLGYTNRALAYLKTERFASAEADCTTALKLDNRSVKALFRRALARKALDHKQEAIDDLKSLLNLEPKNKQAQMELDLLDPKPKPTVQSSLPTSVTNLNRQWKMRRIPIVEVGGGGDGDGDRAPKLLTPKLSTSVDESTRTTNITTLPIASVASTISCSQNITTTATTTISSTVSHPAIDNQSLDFPSHDNPTQPKTNKITNSSSSNNKQIDSTKPVSIPSNWFQLERDLRELCPSGSKSELSDQAVRFLSAIPPQLYADVIRQNLDTRFLSQLIRALSKSEGLTNLEIACRLDALASLPRFDVAWLMTNDQEQRLVNDLKVRLREDASVESKLLDKIDRCFS